VSETLTGADLCEAIETWISDCGGPVCEIYPEDVLDLLATLGYPGAAETYQGYLSAMAILAGPLGGAEVTI
jgi:hypothetical protein